MDVFSIEKRSKIMAKIKGKDTKPEKIIRSLLHKMGYRFRLHRRDLPGNPDIVLPKYKKVIFVHGCFWHGHKGCPRSEKPSSNKNFWNEKLTKNIERDKQNQRKLNELGWVSLVIWQCQIKKGNISQLRQTLTSFLK
ncbi:MAG: DNA mismatch endonuclease Vsr [Desulfobacterales bacterium]|uniref:Very short patch repair endonuclease n=1 Tax=Candidatus Desulfatibia vada TaxID=2841696 RepID=A0A8J6P5K9_9BACT|nr:DNA mismatch endonuclease Vsr [Candidatus Desulfatibia vada]